MNTSGSKPNALATTLAAAVVVSVVGFLVIGPRLTASSAATQEERVLETKYIREHLPIRVKIKKEKEESFKNLKNHKWPSEFELEVMNTGDRPIYFLYISLITDVKVGESRLVFEVMYGRRELGDVVTKALPDDVPIKPKESYIFKLHPGQIPAWEQSVAEGSHPDATKLQVLPQVLSFGDGTGYFVNTPYPPAPKRQANYELKKELPKRSAKTPTKTTSPPIVQDKTSFTIQKPATFSPVNFLSAAPSNSLATTSSAADDSCMFPECVRVIVGTPQYVCYNCPDQLRPSLSSEGTCQELVYDSIECTAGTEKFNCKNHCL